MASRELHGIRVECIQGNIADQPDMDAIVNAANAELRTGGGVAGAVHRAAGPALETKCRKLAPIQPGEAVISSACELPNRHVIHCLGPVYGIDEPSDRLLAACYRNALQRAEDHGIESIAFPALSTGAFGYPMEPATRIALQTILDRLAGLSTIKHVRLVLFGAGDLKLCEQVLAELAQG